MKGEDTQTGRLLASALVLLAMPFAALAQDAPAAPEDALAIFQGDRVVVECSSAGRARLEAAIETLKAALGVPVDLDETRESEVNAFSVAPEARDLTAKLSQGYFTLGVIFAKGESDEVDIYLKGKHWGLKSLRMDPDFALAEKREGFVDAANQETDVPALYWACMNWLSVTNFEPASAVVSGVVSKTVAMLERVLELDETYDGCGADRVLGSVWGALPWLPFGTYRRDLERARSYFCRIVEDSHVCGDPAPCPIDPACAEYLGNRRAFAEYYLMEKGLWSDAAQVLQNVLDAPLGDTYALFNANAQADAQRLLEEVNGHLSDR